MFYLFNETFSEPGFYKRGYYGIRLKNVIEVYDTGKRHPSGARFLAFRDVTLVPYESRMIDRGLLSVQEVEIFNILIQSIYLFSSLSLLEKMVK